MEEITMAMQVVVTAMIRLFPIFPANPRSWITWIKLSNVTCFGKNLVGSDVSSPDVFTEHRSTHTSGKKAASDKMIR